MKVIFYIKNDNLNEINESISSDHCVTIQRRIGVARRFSYNSAFLNNSVLVLKSKMGRHKRCALYVIIRHFLKRLEIKLLHFTNICPEIAAKEGVGIY
jgi:hypothetical protein